MSINTNYLEKLNHVSDIANSTHYSYSTGTLSFSIVYNKNGKRITFSKQLSQRLGLTELACIAPIVDDGVILVAQKLPKNKAFKANLKGDDKKISYNAGITGYLVNAFNLDFATCSSKAFSDITFEKNGDMEVAVIRLSQPIDTSTEAEIAEVEVTENEEDEIELTEDEEDEIELTEDEEGDSDDENS